MVKIYFPTLFWYKTYRDISWSIFFRLLFSHMKEKVLGILVKSRLMGFLHRYNFYMMMLNKYNTYVFMPFGPLIYSSTPFFYFLKREVYTAIVIQVILRENIVNSNNGLWTTWDGKGLLHFDKHAISFLLYYPGTPMDYVPTDIISNITLLCVLK